MAKLRLFYVESDDVSAVAELAGVITRELRQAMPSATVAAPAIAAEPATERTALPAPPRKPKRQLSAPRAGGKNYREKAVEFIRANGPARQAAILRAIGAPKGSGGSIFKDERFRSDDDQLIHVAGETKKATRPTRPKAAKPDKPAAPIAAQVHGSQREERVQASLEHLRKNGPSRKSHIAKACGFSAVYATSLFADERFTTTDRNLMWIAGEPEPAADEDGAEDSDDEEQPEDPTTIEPETDGFESTASPGRPISNCEAIRAAHGRRADQSDQDVRTANPRRDSALHQLQRGELFSRATGPRVRTRHQPALLDCEVRER